MLHIMVFWSWSKKRIEVSKILKGGGQDQSSLQKILCKLINLM